MDGLISTEWLAANLAAPDLRVADCTWFLPTERRSALAEYDAAHIPGAMFLDLDTIADRTHPAPMMLPSRQQFAAQIGALGIGDGHRILLYDASPHHTSARAWAMFRSFGFTASILDGGLAKWRAENRPVEAGTAAPTPVTLTPPTHGQGIVDLDQVRAALADGTQVVDARSPTRFAGAEPEPRPGVVPGHMPGARNLHYAALFNLGGTWKHPDALRTAFAQAGVDLDRPILTTCGSGVTASALAFALHLLGRDAPVYDGSWAEWGADPTTPKVTGG